MSILFHSRNEGKGFSWTFQNIKQIDDLLDQGEVELDPRKRADIYGRPGPGDGERAVPAGVRPGDHPRLPNQVQDVQFNRQGYDAYFSEMWLKK